MNKLLTLTKNTFIETLRQPVYAIIIVAALLLFVISPSLSMFTLDEDTKLLREIGLSTLFLTSLFIAIFSASGAVGEEMENKTIITVLSKPVQRPIFILAKFLGVCGAVILAHYICTIALLMAIRHGVMESVNDTHDLTVIVSAAAVVSLSVLLSAFFNYVYDWRFTSTAIVLTAIFATVGIAFLAFIDSSWQFNPRGNSINAIDIYGSVLLLLAAVIIVALAVALSSRFNIAVTLSACIGIFLLGLVSDYTFGRFADTHLWAKIGRYLVPNLQIFWISDAIYEGSAVPLKYILISAAYALSYTTAIILVAIALFQKRQVG
jgi:ABC-type transport system involved in multi-copper enzyme maturation permease subunit